MAQFLASGNASHLQVVQALQVEGPVQANITMQLLLASSANPGGQVVCYLFFCSLFAFLFSPR